MLLIENFKTKGTRDKRILELKQHGFKSIFKYSDPVEFHGMGTNWWETRWFVAYEAKDLIYAH